jgi:hypothetical protein
LAALAVLHPVHEKNHKKSDKKLKPVFLDSTHRTSHDSTHRASVEDVAAAVRSQRLDSDEDMRFKELMAQFGMMEGELEEAREENSQLHTRIAKEELSFAQEEEKFDGKLVELQGAMKIDDLWAWRLEMGFVAQLVVAFILSLSCLLCQCQMCSKCSPCDALCNKNASNDARNKWAAQHRPMDPELKEKLRVRRMNLDGPGSPPSQKGNFTGKSGQPKSCAYYSLAEDDAEQSGVEDAPPQQAPTAFPTVLAEPPRSPRSPNHSGDQSDWWGSSSAQ